MTAPRQSREDRSADQLLAGKYALGLLSEEARLDVEMRIRRDRGFARMVMEWAYNMDAGLEDATPQSAAQRVATNRNVPRFRRRQRGIMMLIAYSIWQSTGFWRSATLLLLFLVLTMLAG